MLKGLRFSGIYHNKDISVSVMLENPADFNLEATFLVFSVIIKTKGSVAMTPKLEDFTFYIMDEVNCLYNTQSSLYLPTIEPEPEDEESVYQPNRLIYTDFRSEFLFQDLRIVFYYLPYMKFNILELKG